ncbi:glycerophosphodiester phosphodiesterase family protein [Desulfopila inferna]|uniref:glycerophosphodiester phosphodiesterase family protein n=1 Tax=Desulfopila inferna TaxID=468528 RepID=UPI001966A6E3|nr:glycerophosphodiester phosphodiesterase family protein [Desulfopila inferna]MBM9605036.1 hypothetical protein [Desulfopila inferna]
MRDRVLLIAALLFFLHSPLWASQEKQIIYHGNRGSSYSLPSLVIAALQRPDFIELPLLLTRDNIPVVFDDLFLDPQTNVADIFPGRSRQDGNFYLIDFTLSEIQQLSLRRHEGDRGATTHLTSFDDALGLLSHLGSSFGVAPRILPVIKYPWFHANEARDISSIVLDAVIANSNSDTVIFLKCFDPDELQRINQDLLPGLPLEVKLIQGIEAAGGRETMRREKERWSGYSYEWLFTRLGLRVAVEYAYALMLDDVDVVEEENLKRLIVDSQGLRMKIFITVPQDSVISPESFYEKILFELNADGLALEHPAGLRSFLKQKASSVEKPRDTPSPQEKNDASGILSDPDALLERLKRVQ